MERSETPKATPGASDAKGDGAAAPAPMEDVKMELVEGAAPANGTVAAAAPSMLTGAPDAAGDLKLKVDGATPTKNGAAETHRIDIDSAMTRFQRKLGRNWDRYRDTITHFLMGKLSRPELTSVLGSFLTPLEVRTHNYLLLAILANSLRETPPGDDVGLAGWKARGSTRKTNVDTPTELLHREIMALPARERKRIKNIARDNKRPNVPVPQPCLIATRHAMLPHLPYVQDRMLATPGRPGSPQLARPAAKDAKAKARPGQPPAPVPGTAAGRGAPPRGKPGAPVRSGFSTPPPGGDGEIAGADGVVLHSGRQSGPLMWTQDIIHGFEAPLAGETFELPDDDSIAERVLGIALEHGITAGYEAGATDVLLAGVEQYLTTVLSSLAPAATNRAVSPQDPLTARDFQSTFTQRAGSFRELYGPLYRISTHYLRDEDTATDADLEPAPAKRTADEAFGGANDVVQNANDGKQFVRQLLGQT